jgi:hypothetical protein
MRTVFIFLKMTRPNDATTTRFSSPKLEQSMTISRNQIPGTPNNQRRRKTGLLVAVCVGTALVLAACGSDNSALATTPDVASGPTGTATGTAIAGPTETASGTVTPASNSTSGETTLSIAEAIALANDDIHNVEGFVVGDGTRVRLCTALAESFPPQCGQPSLALAGIATAQPETLLPNQLTNDEQIQWTEDTVVLAGVVIGNEFWIAE